MIKLIGRVSVLLGLFGGVSVALAAEARAQGCGEPFAPSRMLPGAQVTIPETNVRLRMPRGWSGRWGTTADGARFYQVTAPPVGDNGVVGLVATQIPDDQRDRSMQQFLMEAANAFLAKDPGLMTGSQMFSLGGNCGGRVMFRTLLAEGSVTLVRAGQWLYGVVAKYPPDAASDTRAGIDTMVATAVLAPPAVANQAAPAGPAGGPGPAEYQGCWERSGGNTNYVIKLRPDGSYSWISNATVSAAGQTFSSTDEEVGSYRVGGGTITMTSSKGDVTQLNVKLESGTLKLGANRYFRC